MRKLYKFLKLSLFFIGGIFVGMVLYEAFWYRNHPEIYGFNSAPWYTNILVYGFFIFVIAAVYGVVLLILKKKIDKEE